MPTIETSPLPALLGPAQTICSDQPPDAAATQITALTTLHSDFAHHPVAHVVPAYSGLLCLVPSGLGIQGVLKSISRGGLQILTPIPVPVRSTVLITIAGCCTIPAEVFYCVKKSTVFQVGIVFSTRHKPEIAVGAFAVIHEFDEPFTVSRGHVMDADKQLSLDYVQNATDTKLPVRVESNGWIIFGQVEGVVASSMLASCVGIHLDAAFPSLFEAPASSLQAESEHPKD